MADQEYNINLENITKMFESAYQTNGLMKPEDAVANYKFLLEQKMAENPGKPVSFYFDFDDLKRVEMERKRAECKEDKGAAKKEKVGNAQDQPKSVRISTGAGGADDILVAGFRKMFLKK
jgi:hypothetical protein